MMWALDNIMYSSERTRDLRWKKGLVTVLLVVGGEPGIRGTRACRRAAGRGGITAAAGDLRHRSRGRQGRALDRTFRTDRPDRHRQPRRTRRRADQGRLGSRERDADRLPDPDARPRRSHRWAPGAGHADSDLARSWITARRSKGPSIQIFGSRCGASRPPTPSCGPVRNISSSSQATRCRLPGSTGAS